ncbi:RagB/SusD family nutrient uptake outer membrane protein [uncultured Bacteroides sp.]|uniref:RagB/SusD family nutrient uptake outer membrane protein n=1 Tax=uncultured Bacteroides sp. TaxID=162156 RepID=UPI002AAC3651|nr:RagB/SusD family nutrient uptake outer membrane protein [uncultured Bacteroides sp.]
MKTKYILTLAAAAFMTVGCTDFLDRQPLDQFTDDNLWTSENNVSVFAFSLYNQFEGYGNGNSTKGFYFKQFNDDMVSESFSDFSKNAPASACTYTFDKTINQDVYTGTWAWDAIRKANVLLERVPKVPMSDAAKAHWTGVARFFRAYEYFNKVKNYGDVPWVNKSLDISNGDILYKARDPRTLVMDSVLADLNYACVNMYANQGDDRVNRNVALALKSRVCLFEGTFRKYHKIADYEKYLQAAKESSATLINSTYKLCDSYRSIYNSLDLSKNSEIIMYKSYQTGVITHGMSGFLTSSTTIAGLNKGAVESYVCKDGLPISQSSLYKGDKNIANVLSDRDGRLSQTIDNGLCYVNHTYKGTTSTTGYKCFKFVNEDLSSADRLAPNNPTDAPLFWLSEVYLNYAEACAELGTLNQSDLDISINKLRTRAGVAPLKVVGGLPYSGTNGDVAINDPKRDTDVSPMIWEIRRERRVELMMDGFRYDDLMRWTKGKYLDTTYNPELFVGANIKDTDPNPSTKIIVNAAGYIVAYNTSRAFDENKHYYLPIPTGQITLNPKLTQNPGW